MHPDPAQADCQAKAEESSAWEFDNAQGFVVVGDPLGEEANATHFRQLLAGFPELVEERHSCLWWLAKQSPYAITKGVQVIAFRLLVLSSTDACAWDVILPSNSTANPPLCFLHAFKTRLPVLPSRGSELEFKTHPRWNLLHLNNDGRSTKHRSTF